MTRYGPETFKCYLPVYWLYCALFVLFCFSENPWEPSNPNFSCFQLKFSFYFIQYTGISSGFMSLCRIARCRLNYPPPPHFTSDPGLSCSNALSRCRPVMHRNVPACHAYPWWRYGSIPVRYDSSWLTVDNPGQLEHGLSISPTPPSIKPSSTM